MALGVDTHTDIPMHEPKQFHKTRHALAGLWPAHAWFNNVNTIHHSMTDQQHIKVMHIPYKHTHLIHTCTCASARTLVHVHTHM